MTPADRVAAPADRAAEPVDLAAEPVDLAAALAGVRALLLDMDGVLVGKGEPVTGAPEALVRLDAAGIPYRLVTNTSLASRSTLARHLARAGMAIPPERIVSAASASAAYAARVFPGGRLYVLASADARTEFDGSGLRLLRHEEVDRGEPADAVAVGDSTEELTYANLNRAFRLIMDGAVLLAMHKNRWWWTPEGQTLDSGAMVAGLEFATERRARIVGKPSRAFFRAGFDELAAEVHAAGGARLHHGEVAMVGDDLWNDIFGAQRAGFRGILVLTGKHSRADAARAAARARGGGRPDAISPSITEVAAALAAVPALPGPTVPGPAGPGVDWKP